MALMNDLIKPYRGCLSKLFQKRKKLWDEFIDSTVFAYSTSCHQSSDYTLFEVMFERKTVLPIDVDLNLFHPTNCCGKQSSSPLCT